MHAFFSCTYGRFIVMGARSYPPRARLGISRCPRPMSGLSWCTWIQNFVKSFTTMSGLSVLPAGSRSMSGLSVLEKQGFAGTSVQENALFLGVCACLGPKSTNCSNFFSKEFRPVAVKIGALYATRDPIFSGFCHQSQFPAATFASHAVFRAARSFDGKPSRTAVAWAAPAPALGRREVCPVYR